LGYVVFHFFVVVALFLLSAVQDRVVDLSESFDVLFASVLPTNVLANEIFLKVLLRLLFIVLSDILDWS